ncbi:MAG: preprotein translocase subunit YajC [Bacteroidetes bacterium]|nr:preprotein translocase subunit YajC [Bacteroidota bacterium]
MELASIFLQAPAGGGSMNLIMFGLLIVVMYLFFFRPQMKRQKEERKFQEEGIQKGMRIVTSAGIHGKILEVQDKTLIIESENTRFKIDRAAVNKEASAVYLPKEEKDKKDSKDTKESKEKKDDKK